VVSHLKVGDFASPLIRAGCADGLLALKPESLALHGHLLAADGWRVFNCSGAAAAGMAPASGGGLDAERLAREAGNPRAVNLVVLGFALAGRGRTRLFCDREAISEILAQRQASRPQMVAASLRALDAGYREGMSG
jgi:indolepyruvate ferredoxin oxidoreductase beta subunit